MNDDGFKAGSRDGHDQIRKDHLRSIGPDVNTVDLQRGRPNGRDADRIPAKRQVGEPEIPLFVGLAGTTDVLIIMSADLYTGTRNCIVGPLPHEITAQHARLGTQRLLRPCLAKEQEVDDKNKENAHAQDA